MEVSDGLEEVTEVVVVFSTKKSAEGFALLFCAAARTYVSSHQTRCKANWFFALT